MSLFFFILIFAHFLNLLIIKKFKKIQIFQKKKLFFFFIT